MHTPRGMYASALSNTNHGMEKAGMTSEDLMRHVFVRNNATMSKTSKESPDLFYCFNRINPDGSPIENPFADDGGSPYFSIATPTITQAASPPTPPDAGSSRGGRSAGYPPSSDCQRRGGRARQERLRTPVQRGEVRDRPRDWGRSSTQRACDRTPIGRRTRSVSARSPRAPSDARTAWSSRSSRVPSEAGNSVSGSECRRFVARPRAETTGRPRRQAR